MVLKQTGILIKAKHKLQDARSSYHIKDTPPTRFDRGTISSRRYIPPPTDP